MNTSRPVRIIQISDIHLFEDPKNELLMVNTEESFQAILDLIKAGKKPIDFIIVSGDLSQDASEKAYRRLAEMVENFKVPVYWIPGNHDDSTLMSSVYPYKNMKNDKHIILPHWQLILLDSHIPGAVKGKLNPTQLKFLSDCLQSNTKIPAVVFLHHQPVHINTGWLDPLGLTNPDDFWNVLKNFKHVQTIFFAHIHQEFIGKFHGIPCYALPSTCIQFKPNVVKFALDDIPPGYRWIELYDDGRIQTGIERAKKYIGVFDKHATGY